MKISIIIPVFNAKIYLENTVKCIMNQTYNNIEVIFVDDCSSDDSFEYLKNLNISNHCIIRNELNLGVGQSRNVGLKNASGELVYFMDADDYIDINYIEELVKNINGYDLLVTSHRRVHINDKIVTKKISNNLYTSQQSILNLILPKDKNFLSTLWNKLFRMDVIRENNLYFEDVRTGEDAIFIFCYLLNCRNVYTKHLGCYYYYRVLTENSLSKNFDIRYIDGFSVMIKQYLTYKHKFYGKRLRYIRSFQAYVLMLKKIMKSNLSKCEYKKTIHDLNIKQLYGLSWFAYTISIFLTTRLTIRDKIKIFYYDYISTFIYYVRRLI